MKRYLALTLTCLFLFSTGVVSARIGYCGDGNQRYSASSHGDTVRYFADVNEFDITQTGSTTMVIEDTVDCRYGRDTLVDISTIEFLEQSFSMEELISHNQTKQLSGSVVQTFLFDNLAAQISNLGVDPFTAPTSSTDSTDDSANQSSVDSTSDSRYANQNYSSESSIANVNSNYTAGSYSSSNYGSREGLSTYNDRTSNSSTSGGYTNPYSSYNSSDFSYNNSYSASNPYESNNTTSNSGFTSNALSSGISTAPLGQITARWNTQAVNPNAIVYIEAVGSDGERHYLGSAMGNQGERALDIPSYLDSESSLTVYVRSGSEVIETFDVEL